MAPIGDMKRDQGKPAQSTVKLLQEELRRRPGIGGGSASLCTSPSQTPALPPGLLERVKKASEKQAGASRCPTLVSVRDDGGKGGFRSGIMSPTQSSDCTGSKVLVGQRSSPTQWTPPAASTLKVPRMASGPPAMGGGVPAQKKKRTRASKKPLTQTVQVESGDFRDMVQTLTGGTYCAQATGTASTIVSSAPSVSGNPAEPSSSTAEPYIVRPQASRPNANGTAGDSGSAGADVPTVRPTGSALPVSQGLPAFLLECMQSDDGGLNYMMGYTSQSSWAAMESPFITTESVGVSVSSQFSGVNPSEAVKASASVYSRASMPFLTEESEVSREGNPYQQEASLDTVCSKGADLERHHPEEDCDVDSWITSDKSYVHY